jgi:hypothetical protein
MHFICTPMWTKFFILVKSGCYKGWETNYYVIINNILEFNFASNKDLKVVFLIVIGFKTIKELKKTNLT